MIKKPVRRPRDHPCHTRERSRQGRHGTGVKHRRLRRHHIIRYAGTIMRNLLRFKITPSKCTGQDMLRIESPEVSHNPQDPRLRGFRLRGDPVKLASPERSPKDKATEHDNTCLVRQVSPH
jgi:hypothetical protein